MSNHPHLRLHLAGFGYADLFDAERLPTLDRLFHGRLERDPALARDFREYRDGAALPVRAESSLLIAVARQLEDFLVDAFGVHGARERLRQAQTDDAPVHVFKEQCVKPQAKRRRATPVDFHLAHAHVCALLDGDEGDQELAIARLWVRARENDDSQTLAQLQDWAWAACNTEAGRDQTGTWRSTRLPRKRDPWALVPVAAKDDAGRVQGPAAAYRRRDGFALTDTRADLRTVMNHVHYCVYCHKHEGDSCSRGFIDKDSGDYRVDPLGVTLTGCPLGEKISEAHLLKREGYTLGALAMIMVDNPLVPATGHRICNDCMKGCVYQKQEPVDVPQIETRILTDVLAWPWGFEIYYLLTRWNPLNRARPYALPDSGRRVLCVGAGPAGFNLAHHLLQDGISVVAIDGLRIEPLPVRWTGDAETAPEPIESIDALRESLDERVMAGFGGVAEYGITVRWDKNFLRLVHLVLARNRRFRLYGGVRFGGTVTLNDAWSLGFDHIALATGAGRPTVVPLKNALAHGMRQANDFLMALQLTGAAKRASLTNLQIRLPAVVVGGGLTAIDAATEAQAYYIRQVEKLVDRYEVLAAEGRQAELTAAERAILDEQLGHGRAVRDERRRAAAAGEAPDFLPLIRRWGGVTVVYRRAMNESPAYLRNHEEIEKALQEGIYYLEATSPVEAVLDEHGHVDALLCRRQVRQADGSWADATDVDLLRLPARTVLIAAGSSPNTVYEREHPGSFAMDGRYYTTHALRAGRLERVDGKGHCKREDVGFFTSHQRDGRYVSVLGDNHPQFHGSVVKAMASGRRAAREIAAMVRARVDEPERSWNDFIEDLNTRLRPRVTGVNRVSPRIVALTIHAPQAARNWRPGQAFRLQTFETRAARMADTSLQMEGMAVSGMRADAERGEIQLLVHEVGASSRLAARLTVGEPIILMGPTGTDFRAQAGRTVAVFGNHAAALRILDSGNAWRASGNRVYFIGHFPDRDSAQTLQAPVQAASDRAIWILDDGEPLGGLRPQDTCFMQGLRAFLAACRQSGHADADWLRESDQLLVCDQPGAMESLAHAFAADLRTIIKPTLQAIAAVTSPMQCMMKEVCAQCLCRHGNGDDATRFVFSCFNQHQPLFDIDFGNLRARQGQNSMQEKITSLWLARLLDKGQRTDTETSDRAGTGC